MGRASWGGPKHGIVGLTKARHSPPPKRAMLAQPGPTPMPCLSRHLGPAARHA